MPDPLSVPAVAIGAATAAAIGGMFALANVVMGKEAKISEARKEWIDGLRTNLASFFGHAQAVSLLWEAELDAHSAELIEKKAALPGDLDAHSAELIENKAALPGDLDAHSAELIENKAALPGDRLPPRKVEAFRSKNIALYTSLLQAFHDVQLRIGTNAETEYVSLRTDLDKVYEAFEGNDPDCHKVLRKNYPDLRQKAATVMKKEWVKVRNGEPSFRAIKWTGFFVVGLGIAWLIWRLAE